MISLAFMASWYWSQNKSEYKEPQLPQEHGFIITINDTVNLMELTVSQEGMPDQKFSLKSEHINGKTIVTIANKL